jgi:hypothetical protein
MRAERAGVASNAQADGTLLAVLRAEYVGGARVMWYMKDLVDRAQVAFILWQLRRRARSAVAWIRPRPNY